MADLEKMFQKEDKVTKMNLTKLINFGIYKGKKQYYKPGEIDPPLSLYISPGLNTFSGFSTKVKVTWPYHKLSDSSSPASTQPSTPEVPASNPQSSRLSFEAVPSTTFSADQPSLDTRASEKEL